MTRFLLPLILALGCRPDDYSGDTSTAVSIVDVSPWEVVHVDCPLEDYDEQGRYVVIYAFDPRPARVEAWGCEYEEIDDGTVWCAISTGAYLTGDDVLIASEGVCDNYDFYEVGYSLE